MEKQNFITNRNHNPSQSKPDNTEISFTENLKSNLHSPTEHSVFLIDDSFYRSRIPRSSHWSIAWSDLMMTMFVLFLTLFVYQLANREFLKDNIPVVAGATIEIPTPVAENKPFFPISPLLSAKKGIVLKKTVTIEENSVSIGIPQDEQKKPVQSDRPHTDEIITEKKTPALDKEQKAELLDTPIDFQLPPSENPLETPIQMEPVLEPKPIEVQKPPAQKQDSELITEMYDLSKHTLMSEKLEKFASVELIPDKTVRLILTGDLLFSSGQATLTETAKQSLSKLAPIIKQTPYMINVVGHTDSVPMHSIQFPTNWELSVARASRVARFLIENIGIPGEQLAVSGHAYHRPVRPNDNETNKKANRRVEIILSIEAPPATQYKENNLFN